VTGRPHADELAAGRSAFASSADGTRIHYLATDPPEARGTGVVVVPGMGESAEEYEGLAVALGPRPAAAVSVRGRGQSEAPPQGYRFEDHVGDLEAVVDDLGWDRFAVVAFSRGSSYGLGLTLRRPEAVPALVVGDYWARHVGLPPAFTEAMLARTWRGRSMTERMPEHAVRQVQAESEEISLWEHLGTLQCPVLLLRPGRRALLDDDTLARWRAHAARLEVAELSRASHDLWDTAPEAVLDAVTGFLDANEA